MKFLDNTSLERSSIVANSRMNRQRGAVGVNSYEKELGFEPTALLADRLETFAAASWLDLCCGRGRALIDAAEHLRDHPQAVNVVLHGIDLVDLFDDVPRQPPSPQLLPASLHQWEAAGKYDLITCVHGLHYVGDKLSLIERAAGWLTAEGLFAANLDLANLRLGDGKPLGRRIAKRFRDRGLVYHSRRLLTCAGAKSLSLGYRYVGADDTTGPNYSGQEAVDSYYEPSE